MREINIEKEIDEIKDMLQELITIINLTLPANNIGLKYIADRTGKTKNAIQYQLNNYYKKDLDWFKSQNGKILVTQKTAIEILMNNHKGLKNVVS